VLSIIGLIGGLSFESLAEYYRLINEGIRERLGGLRSARCLMWSFDFGEIEALQQAGDWDRARSCCWSGKRTARCRCSTPPGFMSKRPSRGR
jgi:aspartate/glutamate racemase